jgi:hypothetical protein
MRALSELSSALLIMAVAISATAGVVGYYTRWVDSSWYSSKAFFELEEYKVGVKLSVIDVDKDGGLILIYNYGWERASILNVTVEGYSLAGWTLIDVETGLEVEDMEPGRLTLLDLGVPFSSAEIELKGGMRLKL